ncbi:MAG: twin-arginine translocase subunit TatC [Verrucomicrobiota bacterium]
MAFFEDSPKGFIEHLEDLRGVLLKSIGVLMTTMCIAAYYAVEILDVLKEPLRKAGQDPDSMLNVLNVTDPVNIHLQISFVGGIIFSLPFIFYFIGSYLLPALDQKERRMIIPVFSAGVILFLVGVLFCYFALLPNTIRVFIEYNEWFGFKTNWTISYYLDFVVNMLLAFGICFELPLVVLLLNFIGIVSSRMLSRGRRHAIVVILVFGAIITPTPDALTLMMLAGPMYILYECCIWLTWIKEGKAGRAASLEDEENED